MWYNTRMNNTKIYCDDCGKDVTTRPCVWVASLTRDISSANAGESAVLCKPCDRQTYNAKGYRKTYYVKE